MINVMQSLSAQMMLQVWESGQRQQAAERMVTLLAAALPAVAHTDLLSLSVGQRDAYLLMLRECTFGPRFAGYAACPRCQERIECSFTISDIWLGAAPLEQIGQTRRMQVGDYELELRLPMQADVLAIAAMQSVAAARTQLLQRCVLQAVCGGETMEVTDLPDEVVHAAGEHIVQDDAQAEVQLALLCPACEKNWTIHFDITTFLWAEIATQAKRLLREVHTLALAYGWSEADILAMSAIRRQCYLEMVS